MVDDGVLRGTAGWRLELGVGERGVVEAKGGF